MFTGFFGMLWAIFLYVHLFCFVELRICCKIVGYLVYLLFHCLFRDAAHNA